MLKCPSGLGRASFQNTPGGCVGCCESHRVDGAVDSGTARAEASGRGVRYIVPRARPSKLHRGAGGPRHGGGHSCGGEVPAEIDDQAAEADGVVIGHGGLVGEGDELIALGGTDFAEGRTGESRLGEAGVEAIKVDLIEPSVGLIDLGDVLQGHLGDQAILEGSALALDAALPLGREGGDGLRAQILKDSSDVSREAYAGRALLMAPVVIVAERALWRS